MLRFWSVSVCVFFFFLCNNKHRTIGNQVRILALRVFLYCLWVRACLCVRCSWWRQSRWWIAGNEGYDDYRACCCHRLMFLASISFSYFLYPAIISSGALLLWAPHHFLFILHAIPCPTFGAKMEICLFLSMSFATLIVTFASILLCFHWHKWLFSPLCQKACQVSLLQQLSFQSSSTIKWEISINTTAHFFSATIKMTVQSTQ